MHFSAGTLAEFLILMPGYESSDNFFAHALSSYFYSRILNLSRKMIEIFAFFALSLPA